MTCASKRHTQTGHRVRFRALSETLPPPLPPLPNGTPEFELPDLSAWLGGNCGIRGVQHFESSKPGPHAVITALMHGNEPTGAYALARLLAEQTTPRHGRLSLIFLNLDAYAMFDPAKPMQSRFIDEDLNRLWQPDLIRSAHASVEMRRLREVLPVIETADLLLDLHTMPWPGHPLFLTNAARRNLALARLLAEAQAGTPAPNNRVLDQALLQTPSQGPATRGGPRTPARPPTVVQDNGHHDGMRLIDYGRFSGMRGQARACLLEAGQHWQGSAAEQALLSARLFLAQAGLCALPPATAQARRENAPQPRSAAVTDCVKALTAGFTFIRQFQSGDIVPTAGTVIAFDGADEIRTPYDDCLLVMPNLRPRRGHTAVRLARLSA
ncbi:succinylglutamate desuccinylase/aspartoacylase family protein [Acetobacter sp. TBRC 12305]|uniref:Succinylglutamate desuccinylase/aspartoacylase family protein n=1 Tax=Acetobacter garciniae TaxID=2817435 RepID=A0A939HNJ9_9PROT|nr:succinylglutamate desuccinylase/aspartoacylase family protein [Acetobacter garciniae]MBO1326385.1 succinylglutamate desuccinylase/aspartoacylase family protein [Acetobacter garciniae]MBX0346160.1 succinylglutamate desuccinylase/aspartoacylase family protein [Acetobacter garciniae]